MAAVIIGPQGRILHANVGANALFGGISDGRRHDLVLRHPAMLDCIQIAMEDRRSSSCECAIRREGRDVMHLVHAAPFGISENWTLVTFQDVSPMQAARQMRRDFVANVSHELRTPLTSLLGFIETIKGPAKRDPDAQARFLDLMESEAFRMNRLIDDLLSLNRVENEERVRPMARVHLNQIAESVVDRMAPIAAARNVALKVEPAAEDRDALIGDADQLAQVLSNLVENAIKYGGADATVTIRISDADGDPVLSGPALRVEVMDEGGEIDPTHIPRLTERFYRIDTHRSREVGGTGLGLAIVKHIVSRHRGRMRIQSAPETGTVVTLVLPRN